MLILGIESSCDECAVSVVRNGAEILSNQVATQIEFHVPYSGVVPEIASRKHTEWILPVYRQALQDAGISEQDLDGIAVTDRPGLAGSLLVGHTFAKGLSLRLGIPFAGVNHILAHLYAVQLEDTVAYPHIGLLVSGGHTMITLVEGPLEMKVIGATIDDAIGEAFDKVAKHLGLGYPGGVLIDELARQGNPAAFAFPGTSLQKGDHRFDISYSGLKTAVINQRQQFLQPGCEASMPNIAASFEKRAVDMLLKRMLDACAVYEVPRVVAAGGVAANTYFRRALREHREIDAWFPSLPLCTDNGAMIAGLGYHVLQQHGGDPLSATVSARVPGFKRDYP
ncbi:tRNA (adenosine(37)-N6)-threonylcarbamoyltransferase complex transferase subunit TsaD [Spirochaeta africana]|uniref:tRNA N6-adenosine threonylcarbamoyltransferase n=1 Tax=Spirochaeta africana (strain ATCC 700263 / DSM 8902 / Z-7692) TaxID=889378 RepID=H9UKB0_SPIAZ|nr:tRNA (adenosine(37)-N6)-threonylcarbamoyltransferase complex transferase subunit TsaD [Spirochaeta africana]AFG37953.1 putative glycoprotease GCP [Spirochaeta africana DSM 8902]